MPKIVPTISKSTTKSLPRTTAVASHAEELRQLAGCMEDSAAEALPAVIAKDLTDEKKEELSREWSIGEETEDLYDYSDGELQQ